MSWEACPPTDTVPSPSGHLGWAPPTLSLFLEVPPSTGGSLCTGQRGWHQRTPSQTHTYVQTRPGQSPGDLGHRSHSQKSPHSPAHLVGSDSAALASSACSFHSPPSPSHRRSQGGQDLIPGRPEGTRWTASLLTLLTAHPCLLKALHTILCSSQCLIWIPLLIY